MKFAFVAPMVTEVQTVELAELGEAHGWDMVFSWEAAYRHDAWATLAAAAARTRRLRLGTLITPAAKYKPWDLTQRVATVDRLSAGRVTLGVGLGALNDNWKAFEGQEPRATRAGKLDEFLEIYRGLLTDPGFSHTGKHWQIGATTELKPGPTVQHPHPPVWAVGALVPGRERQPSLARAAGCDGIFPAVAAGTGDSGLDLDFFAEIVSRLRTLRAEAGLEWDGYDIAVEGDTFGGFGSVHGDPADWARAGATWWVESWWDVAEDDAGWAELTRRVRSGPPGGGSGSAG